MHLDLVSLIVRDYDEAIDFFVGVLGFELTEDTPSLTNDGRPKRWVVVRPRDGGTGLLLARADGERQDRAVGDQFAGRVGLFLRVEDFEARVERMKAAGVVFVSEPRTEPYGRVAVFLDLVGNRWDLLSLEREDGGAGRSESPASRAVVVLPGGSGGPFAPLPSFATSAAEARGAQVHRASWQAPVGLDPSEHAGWVVPRATPVFDEAAAAVPGGSVLVIGKSLGSAAAAVVGERGFPAVWLTPLLTSAYVVAGLRAAAAPYLLVGGTADAWWDGEVARELTPFVLEVEGADHAMEVSGPLAASAGVLGQVATRVEQFLDETVWPR